VVCILHLNVPVTADAATVHIRTAEGEHMPTPLTRSLAAAAFAVLMVIPAVAQSDKPATDAKKKNTPITLTGCVSGKPGATGAFTLKEADGVTYRLSGKGMRKFAGQMVELVGGSQKRLSIRGGLLPSPNIAAQAGALDPAQVAIASQPGGTATSGTGSDLPEFHVARVRGIDGECR
jgi:hypothetical protein